MSGTTSSFTVVNTFHHLHYIFSSVLTNRSLIIAFCSSSTVVTTLSHHNNGSPELIQLFYAKLIGTYRVFLKPPLLLHFLHEFQGLSLSSIPFCVFEMDIHFGFLKSPLYIQYDSVLEEFWLPNAIRYMDI